MMNALRLHKGFSKEIFETRTQLSINSNNIAKIIKKLEQESLLIRNKNNIATTPMGSRYLNTVLEQFMDFNKNVVEFI